MLIIRSELYCTTSGIITPVGGRPVHQTVTYSTIREYRDVQFFRPTTISLFIHETTEKQRLILIIFI